MNSDTDSLSTADLVEGARTTQAQREIEPRTALPLAGVAGAAPASDGETLVPLFQAEESRAFRATWNEVQIGFVDDPKLAVRKADELVAQVMKTMAESFSSARATVEGQVDQPDQASTENLRVALRRYRSFFQRLLAL